MNNDHQGWGASESDDWFWQRHETTGDQTGQAATGASAPVPSQPQLQVAPVEDTQVIQLEHTQQIPAQPAAAAEPAVNPASFTVPAAAEPAAVEAPRPGAARGMAAGLALGVMLGAGVAGPAMLHVANQRVAEQATAPATQQAPTQQAPTLEPNQPEDQSPQYPWEQSDQSDQTRTSPDGQSQVSSAQSRGVVLIEAGSDNAQGAGTGMVVSSDGKVLTNYHVVQSSTQVQVTVASTGKQYTATVLGHDASSDVALLQLKDASGLETVKVDDDELASGDDVTAVGNANGQGFLTAASGRVTQLDATITVSNESSPSGSERLTNAIRTTAQAQPGDSGGPMFDAEGEVVGMTTAGSQAAGGINTRNATVASYAVPIGRAMGIIQQIQQGKESGTVRVGANAYLGITVTTRQSSVQVASVVADGPAAKAGLAAGNVLLTIDGATIDSHAALAEVLATHQPGDRVQLEWLDAQGQTRRGTVELGNSPIN